MHEYRDQGEGELVPGRGFEIVRLLSERRTVATEITLHSGATFIVEGVGHGRDIGAEWEHLYFESNGTSYFLSTSYVAALTAPETGAVLYQSY